MKSLWNCSLAFGNLVIPVQLCNSTQQSHLAFSMVDSRDMSKISMNRFNSVTGEFVPSEFVGKAFDLDGTMVPVSRELIASCIPEKSNILGFTHFAPFSAIDAVRFDSFFYLMPVAGHEADYAIILNQLQSLDMCGITQSYYQNLSALFVIAAHAGFLVLHKIRFDSNFIPVEAPVLPDVSTSFPELKSYLISFFTDHVAPFDGSAYVDTFTESLLSTIRQQFPAVA